MSNVYVGSTQGLRKVCVGYTQGLREIWPRESKRGVPENGTGGKYATKLAWAQTELPNV